MDIWEQDKLILAILFLIPGFIIMKSYNVLATGEKIESSSAIVDALAYSCLNYALFSWVIYLLIVNEIRTHHPYWFAFSCASILFVGPLFIAYGLFKLRSTKLATKHLPHPTPKPWDYIFGAGESFYLVITLVNGQRIGGMYWQNSFTSSYPAEEQIYMEEVWDVDENNGFVKKHVQTRGILISASEISTIEFIGIHDNEQENTDQ